MIRITGVECIPITTVIICIKPRWAQSTETRGAEAIDAGLSQHTTLEQSKCLRDTITVISIFYVENLYTTAMVV